MTFISLYCYCFDKQLVESKGGFYYAELMDVIEQQFVELSTVIQTVMERYQGN